MAECYVKINVIMQKKQNGTGIRSENAACRYLETIVKKTVKVSSHYIVEDKQKKRLWQRIRNHQLYMNLRNPYMQRLSEEWRWIS